MKFCFTWSSFFIFLLIVGLFVIQPNAWAGLSSLTTVDANGDAVFNGDEEKLTITFITDGLGDENEEYTYEIRLLNDNRVITTGPDTESGQTLSRNQTVQYIWDGTYLKNQNQPDGDREKLDDGVYTITVVLTPTIDREALLNEDLTLEADVTLDTKAPEITINIDGTQFSPHLYSLPIYYSIDEDVAQARLEIQKSPSDANIGRAITLGTTSGDHTYNWNGDDATRRTFSDGQYTLILRVIDKGGNESVSGKTSPITLDTEEPRFTAITFNDSISITEGKFVNDVIETINFTADDPGGTGVDLNSRDTDILIRPVGGTYLTGSLSYSNKATLALSDLLDERTENGEYDVIVFVSDNVGNLASRRIRFTFDNTVPILKNVATNNGEFTPGSSLRGQTNYVEATLEDNIALNFTASTIRLIDPSGSAVLGQQSNPGTDIIRWEFLSPLLVEDGLQDGIYNIEIVGADKAGNNTAPIQISFRFDNLAPEIEMLSPTRDGNPFTIIGNRIYHNLPLNQFVVTYSDGESGSGIALSGLEEISSVVFGKSNPDGSITAISGNAFQDTRNGVLTYILSNPLLNTDGSQDGTYRLNVKAADTIGNIETASYQFIYDTQVPTLSSTVPAANATIDNLSEVVVNLTERTSGIDFVQSSFLLKRVVGETQVEVPVDVTSNGRNTATLTLLQPIALDGSDDGTYIIEVTPIDRAGNVGSVVRRQFYLVSQTQPQVRLTAPARGTVSSLSDMTVEIANYIGSGINYDLSTIVVRNSDGTAVPQAQVDSDPTNNQLTWSTEATIPRNGTADGEYTVTAIIRDFSGEVFLENFSVVLDTQFPSIDSVNAIVDPQQQLSISSTTDIHDTFSQINVEFDSSDVDFESTIVTLAAPDATEIALHRRHDGASNLTLNFQNLTVLGTYTLTVTSSDNVGNVSASPFIYRFKLEIDVPIVSTVLIGGQTAPIVYVDGSNPEIIATFVDTTGTGLALGEGESSIVVLSASGIAVPGLTTTNNDNQLVWQPVALPNDGSADGQYIVTVTPVDKAGRSGDVAYRTFIFDTQSPRISAATPVTLHQPVSHIGGSLSQLQFTVEDVGPALLNLDSQVIGLQKDSGEQVPGHITNDGVNQIFFTLATPLPTDGTADGEYKLTIDLEDKAGNSYQSEHKILYDSQTPQLASVSLNTDVPLDLTPYQVTDLTESINQLTLKFVELSQVDFANTQITLIGPDGSAVPLIIENNGTDQIVARFVTLSQGGLYTLSITPRDIVGNVAQGAIPYPFRLMIEVPGLSSVVANSVNDSYDLTSYQITDISNSIGSLTFSFTDGTRVDFENTNVTLIGPDGQEISITQEEIEDTQLLVRFLPLTQSGLYELSVTPQDIIGNVAQRSIRYQFRLDISFPTVSSVLIGGRLGTNVYVNSADTNIVVTFTDASDVGLALGNGGSTITVNSDNGSIVSGITTSNGTNQLTWTPSVLPTDGSADGRYTVSITPVDKAGRSGAVVNRHFIYDTQEPRITDATPVTLHQPVSYVGEGLTQFQFTVEDVGPALLDLDMQSISLEKANVELVKGVITNDGANQLYYTLNAPLPTDGSVDGAYILNVNLIDKAGNRKNIQHNIIYDSLAPKIASVSLDTETTLSLIPYEVTELSENINKLTVSFDELTRVDFANTMVALTGPEDSAIPLTLANNGKDALTVSFLSLTQSGLYTLTITPQDITGNVAQGAISYPFRLKFSVPGLSAVKANTVESSVELTAYQTTVITGAINSFTFEFADAMRVDYTNTQVTLRGSDGQEIPVTLEGETGSDLVVRFVSLTQSGEYTLSVRIQDISGNVSQGTVQYPFRLKFPVPGLSAVKANTVESSVELTAYQTTVITDAINSFTFEFADAIRVDYENTQVTLRGSDGQEIPVTLEGETGSDLVVRFVSLTQSGEYMLSVRIQDTSGNVSQGTVQYPFRLRLPVAGLSSVKAIFADTSLELTPYEIVEITETVNGFSLEFLEDALVDFENTSVILTDPNGQEISVTIENDEKTKLLVRFVSLVQSGLYTLSILPQDVSGNAIQGAIPYPFRLKFEVPGLATVRANAAETSADLIQHQVVELSDSINSLTLEFTDAMRVDFDNTAVTLTGPNGENIGLTLEENDDLLLMVHFVPLTQSGIYTLNVTPQDKSGNVAPQSIQYQFKLDMTLPSVSSVVIDGKFGSTVYVRSSIPRVVATITDSIGVGLSLGDSGSSIVVRNSVGDQISGTTTSNGADQLIWTPIPLPTDGTADGIYTVAITPMDKAGRSGTVANRQFIYDTQAPRITSAGPVTLHAPISYVGGGLEQFVLTIEDVGPAGLIYASQVVALLDGNEKPVPAVLTFDELTNQLYLTLNKPFASDGSEDGPYTLHVLLIDKAGNQLTSQFTLVYDSIVPEISSVEVNTTGNPTVLAQNDVADLTEAVDTITIKFDDATRVDFANTSVSLLDPDDLTVPLTLGNDGVSQMTLRFVGLTKIGQYILSVSPQDIAGNARRSPNQYSFTLEFILPDVESVVIGDTVTLGSGDITYVNADNIVIVANLLDPADTGLSFDSLTGSDILVATLDGVIVPGTIATNGTDVLAWSPLTLSSDGSSDGRYAVYVTPVDKQGREGSTIYREFIYDTQEPEITNASPINLSQPVSYISASLTQLEFTLQDVGPADLTLADQIIRLRNQSGGIIPTKLTNDNNSQLYLTLDQPLPLDGSQDGQYTVEIELADKAGNVLSLNHPIVYDTQAPTVVSTVPEDGALLTEDITQFQVNLNDEGGSGIDWDVTSAILFDPNGVEISGELSSNGTTQLTLRTNQLVADGRYIIRVQAVDRAGNGSSSVFDRSFLLSRRLPAVLSTSPITAPQDDAYTNEDVEEIEVLLETVDERHLSTVRLLNAAGQVIAGQQNRQDDGLVYTLVRPLATDGSEDGIYTIEFTPISSSGRSGEVQQLAFTYDTQTPEIETDAINLIVSEPEVNNSLVEIRVVITDNEAGIDWENLDEDWLTFERLSPNATEIEGQLSYETGEVETLVFRLTVPLADDGSADGEYKIIITPTDKAGNGEETYERVFTYDTSAPVIDPNSLLINDVPLLTDIDLEDYPSAISTSGGVVIQASVTDTGLGVNLSQSRIVITNPNGQEVSGTTQQNGIDTIVFKSDGLNIEGIYGVQITGIGNDSELLGFAPKGSITTTFLYETTSPTAIVTNDGGKNEFTDEAIPFEGTASDPEGVRRAGGAQGGEGEIPVPASGVKFVEIVGTGPDGQPIEPVLATDESNAQQPAWSVWSADFLPTRSGEYDLDIRVTDNAGNSSEYDIGEYTMSVSFSFKGKTFGWPNPLRHSKEDVAFISFDLNTSTDESVELKLYIYDWGGDLVYSKTYTNVTVGERNDTQIKWNLENQAGTPVARGIYVFRLEAVNGAGNSANAVGKLLVVD